MGGAILRSKRALKALVQLALELEARDTTATHATSTTVADGIIETHPSSTAVALNDNPHTKACDRAHVAQLPSAVTNLAS